MWNDMHKYFYLKYVNSWIFYTAERQIKLFSVMIVIEIT